MVNIFSFAYLDLTPDLWTLPQREVEPAQVDQNQGGAQLAMTHVDQNLGSFQFPFSVTAKLR